MRRTKNISNVIAYASAAVDYTIRTEQHQGKTHLVVPVVMMVEGVHSGSGGPVLHLTEELGRVTDSWNGIPITISHPHTQEGFISANSPKQIERCVGRVYNAHMDGDKLKAEAWLNETMITALSPTALAYIRQGKPLDVSVGIFTDNDNEEGEWNGEEYVAIARNYRPDHLALLPDEEGACSWGDGCGIRNNSRNTNSKSIKNDKMEDLITYKGLNKEGLAVIPVVNNIDVNAINLNAITSAIYTIVNALDNDLRVFYVEEIYDTFYIYRARNRANGETKMYKQTYSVSGESDNAEIHIESDPFEVQRTVNYETLQKQQRRTKFNTNKKDEQMADVTKLVDGLVTNGANHFTECDRAWLSTLSEEALGKIGTKVEKAAPITLDANSALSFLKINLPKTEDVLQLFSKEDRAMYDQGIAAYKAQRKTLTDAIIAANSEQWKENDLETMDIAVLEKIAKTVATVTEQVTDYSGLNAGGVQTNASADEDFLPLAGSDKK